MNVSQIAYEPLDVLKPVTDSVWIVDSGPVKAMGLIPLPVRMTVLRLRDGSLLLYSPTRFDEALRRGLEQIGPIAHVIAPNTAHWMFVKQWQENCPQVRIWGAPGLGQRRQVKQAGVRLDHELGPEAPAAWAGEIDQLIVEGVGFAEVALLHRPSRSVILTDLVQNLEPAKLHPLFRPAARLAGVTAPNGKAPIYLRAIVKMKGREPSRTAKALVNFQPSFVIFSHGRWYDARAAERLRQSLAWLLD